MFRRLALLAILPLLLALLLPAPCLAADSSAEPAPNSAAKTVAEPALDPDMDEGHRLFAHEKYEEALKHYLKALKRNEEDAYLYFRIGLTYYMLDDMRHTEKYWGTAYALDHTIEEGYISKVNSEAMHSTLIPGDILITDDQYYKYRDFGYNDVVSFYVPTTTTMTGGRILALPEDYVEMKGDVLYLNDKIVKRNFLFNGVKSKYAIKNFERTLLLKNHVAIVNDNKNWHYDSRFFGPVDIKNIYGKDLVILKSIEQKNEKQREREERFGIIIK